ncbi:hypothetical protein [Macrococcus armenti]|uniref:hypothetical protein n=1 Tax=Macrococcus armenti TaxID=2875764 RepID=UPI001CCF89A0|nr:hypothetical protein [Macrococcus armenti]UBH15795.1 hypothetical protein LAU44_02270 [Macrococcus armenti]UBH18154.1 hypothetical protein LAU39_02275 [Macrococcus armenti]UBH20421.1 hypothetical protein LAU40_02270 [Macrococcus armenti]
MFSDIFEEETNDREAFAKYYTYKTIDKALRNVKYIVRIVDQVDKLVVRGLSLKINLADNEILAFEEEIWVKTMLTTATAEDIERFTKAYSTPWLRDMAKLSEGVHPSDFD